MSTVYRVELPADHPAYRPTRHGPYTAITPVSRRLVEAHVGDYRRPSPRYDFPDISLFHEFDTEEFFGFKSMQDLYAWFGGWITPLLAEGFKIVKYDDVMITHEGQYQVSFIKPLDITLDDAIIDDDQAAYAEYYYGETG